MNTRQEMHDLIDMIFELKDELVQQSKFDSEFLNTVNTEQEKKDTIDYYLSQRNDCDEKMRFFNCSIQDFWRYDMDEARNIYQQYFIRIRDSMKNKYYGNGTYLYPEQVEKSNPVSRWVEQSLF